MRVGQQHLRVTMAVGRKQLGEILVEQKLISHDQLIRALEQQQRTHSSRAIWCAWAQLTKVGS